MLNFNKFLTKGEVETLIIYPRTAGWQLYFYLFLIIVLFFLLYPLWHLGSQGLILWCLILAILLFSLANYLLKKNTYYLVTNLNIWHVFYVNENNIRVRGQLPLNLVESISARSDNDIVILANQEEFVLFNLQQRNFILAKLQEIILPKTDKSVII